MNTDYKGIIIEESLEDPSCLVGAKIIKSKTVPVTPKHKTPWVKQWTMHTVVVPSNKAESVAEKISKAIDDTHESSWYADFKSDKKHYIIFRDKVFFINRNKNEYKKVMDYGTKLGIPKYQLDFPGEES